MSRSAYGADTAWTRARPLLVALVLAAAVAIAYRQAISCGFVYDDATVIVENRHLRGGPTWENLRWAFTTFHTANWLPLMWASHQIDVGLFGLKPAGHHLVNVLLHAASAILLFRVLELLAGRTWPAALVAALFALHPLHVESVAWISERKDVLSALFWMLTLGAYLRYARRPSASRLLGTAALLALGLMAKPMLVTLPFALLLLDWWPPGRFRDPSGGGGVPFRALLAEKAPLFALSAASCAMTWAAQRSGDAVKSTALFPWAGRVEDALASYAAYLAGTFWPAKLAVFYPYPEVVDIWQTGMAALLLITITVCACLQHSKRPFFIVGWLWFLIIQWPDRYCHTSEDTPDKVSPDTLARSGALAATYAYWMATAGEITRCRRP